MQDCCKAKLRKLLDKYGKITVFECNKCNSFLLYNKKIKDWYDADIVEKRRTYKGTSNAI